MQRSKWSSTGFSFEAARDASAVNYYNYFTEIEDHFRQARRSGMFMLSPLDWALIESWKDGGIPLEAVLRGIDRAFEKYHARRRRHGTVNSVAYCTQEVLGAARDLAAAATLPAQAVRPGLDADQLAKFFDERLEELRGLAAKPSVGQDVFAGAVSAMAEMASQARAGELDDLEAAEQRLTVLEDRVVAVATARLSEDQLLTMRRELDDQLRPYRRKMSAEQIGMMEQRFMRRRSLEQLGLSRLSLFYAV